MAANGQDRDAGPPRFDLLAPAEKVLSWGHTAVATWLQRTRDRDALANLSELQRRDIGLAQDAIDLEVRKPFWRA